MIHEAVEIDLKNRMPYWNGIAPRMNLARHTPLQALYKRSIDVAVEEARDVKDGLPTDDAILAVDWIFRKAEARGDIVTFWMSFENACHVLGADPRRLRGNIRVYLGYQVIATAQADAARINALLSKPLQGDDEELFEATRCVPVLDQAILFPTETVALMSQTYQDFLRAKSLRVRPAGLRSEDVLYHPAMKPSYWHQACANMQIAAEKTDQVTLFASEENCMEMRA